MSKTEKVVEGKFVTDEALDYQALRDEFIEWLAVPASRREPRTQDAMAEHLGVRGSTLSQWKRDPRIVSAMRAKIKGVLTVSDLPDIVDTLKEQAFNPENPRSVQASKLLIEMMQESDADSASVPLGDMSNEDLRTLAAKLHDVVDERIESA